MKGLKDMAGSSKEGQKPTEAAVSLSNAQATLVSAAIVAELMDRFDDPYSGAQVLSEFQARSIAGGILQRVDHQCTKVHS